MPFQSNSLGVSGVLALDRYVFNLKLHLKPTILSVAYTGIPVAKKLIPETAIEGIPHMCARTCAHVPSPAYMAQPDQIPQNRYSLADPPKLPSPSLTWNMISVVLTI